MLDVAASVPSVVVKCDWHHLRGHYKYVGHIWGFPAWSNGTFFLCHSYPGHPSVTWGFGTTLGQDTWYLRTHDPTQLTLGTEETVVWSDIADEEAEVLHFDWQPQQVSLKDELVTFLTRKAQDKDVRRQLELSDNLLRVTYGPPKALARALQKGPEWLLDLNRCTVEADCYSVLVLAFLLVKNRIEQKGGRITRFDNYHLLQQPAAADFGVSGGILNLDLKRPPCLHLNYVMDGWSFEVMFMLCDFVEIKHRLHKFYDVVRAKDISSLYAPVFPNDDSDADDKADFSQAAFSPVAGAHSPTSKSGVPLAQVRAGEARVASASSGLPDFNQLTAKLEAKLQEQAEGIKAASASIEESKEELAAFLSKATKFLEVQKEGNHASRCCAVS